MRLGNIHFNNSTEKILALMCFCMYFKAKTTDYHLHGLMADMRISDESGKQPVQGIIFYLSKF